VKRDCIFCRGTKSHRNNATKANMCPAAYANKLMRQRVMYRRQDWVTWEQQLLRDRARRVEKRISQNG
jgi:hypothetical protein